jgi:hypothetical protein
MCMNERILLFDLPILSFEPCLQNHHAFLAQKAAKVSKRRLKRMVPWKVWAMDSLVKEKTNLIPHFTWEKSCFLSTDWCQGCGILEDKWPTFTLKSVAVLHLHVVLRIARYVSSLVSFDRYTFHRVACEIWTWVIHVGLENRATPYQKTTVFKGRLPPAFFKLQSVPSMFYWLF